MEATDLKLVVDNEDLIFVIEKSKIERKSTLELYNEYGYLPDEGEVDEMEVDSITFWNGSYRSVMIGDDDWCDLHDYKGSDAEDIIREYCEFADCEREEVGPYFGLSTDNYTYIIPRFNSFYLCRVIR